MFWKYDDEEDKVVKRTLDQEDREVYTPSEFAEKAKEAGHASFVHGLDEEDQEKVFKSLEELRKEIPEEEMLDDAFPVYPNSDETGAEERFESRVAVFQKENKPVFKHHFWWFVHNCLAHPAIGIAPCKKTFDFHDWTSKKINAK